MSSNTPSVPVWRKRTSRNELILFAAWVLTLAFVSWAFQVMTNDTIWAFVSDAPKQMQDIGSRMMPPAWSFVHELWWPLWETINIATLGTLLGLLMAVPVAFMAARNTTPSTKLVRPVALLLIVGSRSINSLIWALLLVAILGPGVLAGILAIALRSIGFIGKLLCEAKGASPAQTMALGRGAASCTHAGGHQRLSLGHQHPRIHRAGFGWRRRTGCHARVRAQHPRLAQSHHAAFGHSCHGGGQRVGDGQGTRAPDLMRPHGM